MTKKQGTNSLTRRGVLGALGAGAATSLISASSARSAVLPKGRRSETFDIIVIGNGMAGLAAGLQAALDGAAVVVLDKMPEQVSGGNSRLAGGLFAIPSTEGEEARQAYIEDFVKKCQGRANSEIINLMAGGVRDGVAWLKTQGVEFLPDVKQPPYRLSAATAAPGVYRGMPKLLATLTERLKEKGGKLVYETKAKQLIVNELGRVAGVKAIGAEGIVDYDGRAVIIASGGYAGNAQILSDYVDPNGDAMLVRGAKWATGDGLMMAQDVGAGLRNMGGLTSLHIAAVNPKQTASGNPFAGLPYCLAINREGKRYIDESRGYVANGKAALTQPGQSVTLIFDEDIARQPGPASSIGTFKNLGLEIVEAGTIEELAGKIGVPAAALSATVETFNDAVENGAAPRADPPKATLAFKIEKPKFYAFTPLVPGVTLTFGGIMINANAQVLETDSRIVPGLYAAGEGAGHVFYDDYIGGGSLANCLVMGRIAGRNAASVKT